MQMNIVPVQVFPNVASVLKIGVAQIRTLGPGGDAMITWHLLDSHGMTVQTGVIPIVGGEYDNWGNDDTYILNKVAQLLGLTPT